MMPGERITEKQLKRVYPKFCDFTEFWVKNGGKNFI